MHDFFRYARAYRAYRQSMPLIKYRLWIKCKLQTESEINTGLVCSKLGYLDSPCVSVKFE